MPSTGVYTNSIFCHNICQFMRLDRSFDGSSRIFISPFVILSLHQKR
nr:MAG TPA: hypothetical protein [Caudoviricetes sp.]